MGLPRRTDPGAWLQRGHLGHVTGMELCGTLTMAATLIYACNTTAWDCTRKVCTAPVSAHRLWHHTIVFQDVTNGEKIHGVSQYYFSQVSLNLNVSKKCLIKNKKIKKPSTISPGPIRAIAPIFKMSGVSLLFNVYTSLFPRALRCSA